jgi:aminopeptidase N
MMRGMSRRPAALAVAAASGLLVATLPLTGGAASAASNPSPTPGSAGLGDRLYPLLGNGGYDALHYDLDLRYATTAPSQGVVGTVTMRARATQSLSRFDLDFSGKSVGAVSVNGDTASFTRNGGELVITPGRPIRKGAPFIVRVTNFTANPTVPGDTDASVAFFITAEGSATAGQPDAMHYLYPSNDHPSDKAGFSFRFDVPKGETAVANGDLTGRHTRGARTIWTYTQRQPMATELTQVVVGKYTVIDRGRVDGVPVRDVVATSLVPTYQKLLAVEKSHIRWMQAKVGGYPFDRYGTLVVTAPTLGFALETQTLSLFDTTWFTDYPRGVWAPAMLHELAHQWFGDSVSPKDWSDIWLNEGHASWYEFNYAAEKGYLQDDESDYGEADLTSLMKDLYAAGDQYRADDGPVALPLDADHVFSANVYEGGALALYALRQKIGAAAFDKVERAWVRRYQGGSASTDDFITLASRVSGRNLTGFLRSWLYGTTTPAMPGHPDWTVDPVEQALSASARSAAGSTALATPPKVLTVRRR